MPATAKKKQSKKIKGVAAAPIPPKPVPTTETVVAYKGFNANFQCRGFQFEVGKTYEHAGPVIACESGFHACTGSPFDVLDYYGFCDEDGSLNRFGEVVQGGQIVSKGNKSASATLTIRAEIALPQFIKRGVDWLIAATKPEAVKADGALNDNGGDDAQIGSSGHSTQIGSSGNYAQIGSSGHYAQIGSSGHYAKIGSSGHHAKIGSSGHSAQIGSSGDAAQIGSSGHYAKIGSSGDAAQIGSSGHSAQIGSSGDAAKIGSSGDYAKIGSSGDAAQIVATGKNAIAASAGSVLTFKLGDGGCIALPWHDGKRTRFTTVYVGEDGIKADTFYTLKNGKPVEV